MRNSQLPFRLTPVIKVLLIANFIVFVVQHTSDQYMNGNFIGIFGLIPSRVVFDFFVWQPITYMFLHGDVSHLVLNMLMLLFIGSELEALWGPKKFLTYYFVCGVSAGVVYLLMQVFISGGLGVPMVGASGGIFGLLTAYGILFSERQLLFMMLFPLKAKQFVWLLAGIEFMTLAFSRSGGLSSVAHLTGMGAGFLYLWGRTWYLAKMRLGRGVGHGPSWLKKAKPLKSKNKKKRKSHLSLVVDNDLDSFDQSEDSDSGPKTWH
ncbi:MAG: rhomboid family intramembrane serine protease [Bdellovibrionaceae bacterium]|nr:rhomboid family intramembrane serine protease [Pseudobdellovibrionaceae bacterium]|tara:strand:- start:4367 stop:5158 length:792 start_codon:yes stop_codon:yes gene_type:complete